MDQYLSELRLMSFGFNPKGWALCEGQFLPINQNQALFSLLGTVFGGNGQTTFALPDLRGRTPIHQGAGFILGQRGGEEAHALSQSEMPAHAHSVLGSPAIANDNNPTGELLAAANDQYHAPADLTTLAAASVTSVGQSAPHPNMPPFLTLSWCIALQGIFPSRV
jgi:microcystin-dependent protein